MIKIEKYIPNTLTLTNLALGFFGIMVCFQGNLPLAAVLVFAGALIDFVDGYSARLLNAHSEMGKQLDSLADLVTFSILPAIIIHILILKSRQNWMYAYFIGPLPFVSVLPLLLPVCAAIRLAKYNIDSKSEKFFKGLPTPAAGLFFASLPLIIYFDIWQITSSVLDAKFLIISIFIISFLMVSNVKFFNLKLDGFSFKKNWFIYVLAILSLTLYFPFYFAAVPMIILAYFILSVIWSFTAGKQKSGKATE